MDVLSRSRSLELTHFSPETSLIALAIFGLLAVLVAFVTRSSDFPGLGLSPYLKFVYANFVKPHDAKTSDGQQSALESFYGAQVG
jgi:betaine lipid synthase